MQLSLVSCEIWTSKLLFAQDLQTSFRLGCHAWTESTLSASNHQYAGDLHYTFDTLAVIRRRPNWNAIFLLPSSNWFCGQASDLFWSIVVTLEKLPPDWSYVHNDLEGALRDLPISPEYFVLITSLKSHMHSGLRNLRQSLRSWNFMTSAEAWQSELLLFLNEHVPVHIIAERRKQPTGQLDSQCPMIVQWGYCSEVV